MNLPAMSLTQSPLGCITGIANVYFGSHTVLLSILKNKKLQKRTICNSPKIKGPPKLKLIKWTNPASILPLARSVSAPSARAEFEDVLAFGFVGSIMRLKQYGMQFLVVRYICRSLCGPVPAHHT